MSPKTRSRRGRNKKPAGGTLDRKISRDDIEKKLQELRGEVDDRVEEVKVPAIGAVIAGVFIAICLAYLMGKRRGKKRQTVLEIRRI